MPSLGIVDSGPLIAVANQADPDHSSCLELLQSPGYELVVPTLCIAEVAYVLQSRHGSAVELRFLRGLGAFDVQAPTREDWLRIAEIVEQYRSFPLGTVDASIVALAERLETDLILTLDHRHFRAVRPRHADYFTLLPQGA